MYTKPKYEPSGLFKDFPTVLSQDVLTILCGNRLGSGISRQVYECRLNPDYVVKVEQEGGIFYNVHEWEFWSRFQYVKHVANWLAPCSMISPNGKVLIQRQTKPPGADFKWPRSIPSWFSDAHKGNFGLLDGRLVCHDYGIHLGLENGVTKRMKKWDWYEGTNDS